MRGIYNLENAVTRMHASMMIFILMNLSPEFMIISIIIYPFLSDIYKIR